MTATGSDAARVKAAVADFNAQMASLVPALSNGIAQRAAQVPGIDKTFANAIVSLKSIKITAAGTKATGTATVKDANQTVLLMPMGAYLIDRGMHSGPMPPAPARARPGPGMPPQ